MSYITRDSNEMFKNERNNISLDKDLFAFASSFGDAYFANDMNWKKVAVQFKHTTSNQKKTVVIGNGRNDGWFEASTLARTGSWQIDRIQVFDKDGDMETITRAGMPSPEDFDIETKARVAPAPLVTAFVENSDIITNGSFDSGVTGWNLLDANYNLQNNGSNYIQLWGTGDTRGILKHFATVPGRRYKYSFRVVGANQLDVRFSSGQLYTMTDVKVSPLETRLGLTGDNVYTGEFTAAGLNTTFGAEALNSGEIVSFTDLEIVEVCYKLEVADGDAQYMLPEFKIQFWDENASQLVSVDTYEVEQVVDQPGSQLIVFKDQFNSLYEGKNVRLRFPEFSLASSEQKSMFQYVGNVFV